MVLGYPEICLPQVLALAMFVFSATMCHLRVVGGMHSPSLILLFNLADTDRGSAFRVPLLSLYNVYYKIDL